MRALFGTGYALEQVLDMVAAIAKIPGDAGYREPILQAVLDSLRPPSARQAVDLSAE